MLGNGTDDLELVLHTPTTRRPSPAAPLPIPALIAYEATASGSDRLQSLSGQVAALPPPPARDPSTLVDEDVVCRPR